MSDDIARVIRRDLDSLPLLPPNRWVPAERHRNVRLQAVWATALIAAVALALSSSLLDLVGGAPPPGAPPTTATATPFPTALALARQDVLARVRSLPELPRVVRIEAKLVSAAALESVRTSPAMARLFAGRPAAIHDAWIVAVSGEIECNCPTPPTEPLRSAVYWIDPASGGQLARMTSADAWPPGFDALADQRLAPNVVSALGRIVAYQAPDTVVIETITAAGSRPAGGQLTLRGHPDTAYSVGVGAASVSAVTLEDLARAGQLGAGPLRVVQVLFDDQPQPDGSYRLEWLRSTVTAN